MAKTTEGKILFIVAIVMYILALIMLGKGINKMTKYYHSEYSSYNDVNAYVGGDAYNYIINAGYATGFYVLSMGFLITGTIMVVSSVLIDRIPDMPSEWTQNNRHQEIISAINNIEIREKKEDKETRWESEAIPEL